MNRYTDFSDEQLAALLKEDDKQAFSELYNRYWPMLWRFAANSMKSSDDAKDIIQDVFTGLLIQGPSIIKISRRKFITAT